MFKITFCVSVYEFLFQCVRASVRAHVTSLMGLAHPDWGGESLTQATGGEEE